jgi:hypothetical protein
MCPVLQHPKHCPALNRWLISPFTSQTYGGGLIVKGILGHGGGGGGLCPPWVCVVCMSLKGGFGVDCMSVINLFVRKKSGFCDA